MTILDLSADQYHADATGDDRPSLSSSLIDTICRKSALHAWTEHPRLNPNFKREHKDSFDLGNAVHAQFLEDRSDTIHLVDAKDWRTKAAQEAKFYAYENGLTPILASKWERVQELAAAIREKVDARPMTPPLFREGKPEIAITWEERGVLCRALFDWLHDDHSRIDDLKTTGKSADALAYSRALYGVGGDIQAAFYLRGLAAISDTRPSFETFRWIVVEIDPPYELSVISPKPQVLELANRKIDHALEVWKRCLDTDTWPGYPDRIAYAELPAYEESRWLEREVMNEWEEQAA